MIPQIVIYKYWCSFLLPFDVGPERNVYCTMYNTHFFQVQHQMEARMNTMYIQWRFNVSDFYSSSCVHLDTLTVGNRGTKSCRKDLNFQQYKEACNE